MEITTCIDTIMSMVMSLWVRLRGEREAGCVEGREHTYAIWLQRQERTGAIVVNKATGRLWQDIDFLNFFGKALGST